MSGCLDRQQAEQPLKLCRLYLLDDIGGEVYGNQRGVERGQKSGATLPEVSSMRVRRYKSATDTFWFLYSSVFVCVTTETFEVVMK